jgi:hypothetical protein
MISQGIARTLHGDHRPLRPVREAWRLRLGEVRTVVELCDLL